MFTAPPPLRLIAGRAERLLDRLTQSLLAGRISTRTELLIHLLAAAQRFARTLRGPSLEVPQMERDDLLSRHLVEIPIRQASEDVELAFDQTEGIRLLTGRIVNLSLAEHAGLQERLAELTSRVDAFRLWVSDRIEDFVWAGDTFNDLSKVDPSSSAWVNTLGGWVSLQPVASRSMTEHIIHATLDREYSAGGLPGNNLEIRAPGQEAFTGRRPEPQPVLYRDTVTTDRLTALWDGNPGTWFEWERVIVPVPQRTIKVGKAFVYDPSGKPNLKIPNLSTWQCYIRWPGELGMDTGESRRGYPLVHFTHPHGDHHHDHPQPRFRGRGRRGIQARYPKTPEGEGRRRHRRRFDEPVPNGHTLRLGILIELDEPRPVSWMELTPLVRAGTYPTVEQILVSYDGERWRKLLAEPTTLHPRMNRGVDLARYGIAASNFEGIGVWPLPATPIRFIKLLLKQEHQYECPLGIGKEFLFHKKKKKRLRGPILVVGDPASTPADGEGFEAPDFSETPARTRRRLIQAYDIFRAFRQVIAIRDLILEERLYGEDAVLLSKPHTLTRPAKAVSLLVTERIPEEWAAGPGEGRWIDYEVSADGQNWTPIIPQETELEDSVVHFEQPTTTLYLRATFSRPDDAPNGSPVLLAYALKGLPA